MRRPRQISGALGAGGDPHHEALAIIEIDGGENSPFAVSRVWDQAVVRDSISTCPDCKAGSAPGNSTIQRT
jgi:hypothetical protein